MLLIGLTSLLIAIPLYSSLTPSLLTRITSIILLFSAALSLNSLYVQAIGSGLGLYSGLFHVTSVTQFMEVFLFTVGAFVLVPWAPRKKRESVNVRKVPSISEYPLIILFTTIGASFLISSADLVSMYLSIELQSFAVYILAAIYRNSESATSAGLKYFLLGALSSALILLGSRIIYAYTGLTSFESITRLRSLSASSTGGDSRAHALEIGRLIIGVGFLFKVAAAPFHNWAPDVYDGVPTIVTTWLTVMPKISIFIFLLSADFFNLEAMSDLDVWKNLLLTTSLLSLVIGTVVGLAQYRIKRLLAFSTISHVGFMLLALSVNSEESITSFLFYLMQYSITNLNAFFVLLAFGYVIRKHVEVSFISQLKGQFQANPVLGLSLALCLFSMAGIPPLVGFFAKYRVLYSAIENGYYFLAIVGILASVVSAAYYLRVIRVIHFDAREDVKGLREQASMGGDKTILVSSTHSFIIAVLTLFILLFIVSPSLLLNSSNLLALSLFSA